MIACVSLTGLHLLILLLLGMGCLDEMKWLDGLGSENVGYLGSGIVFVVFLVSLCG